MPTRKDLDTLNAGLPDIRQAPDDNGVPGDHRRAPGARRKNRHGGGTPHNA